MKKDIKMPVLFVGHGSPMNGIEENNFTKNWSLIAKKIPKPTAILCISAHWYTKNSKICDLENPKLIYDMYGFPKEVYEKSYPVKGSISLSKQIKELLGENVEIDNTWGIDHGTWSVLSRMYPDANIPTVQLSINYNLDAESHYLVGREIKYLRNNGVLIIGSGNIVHNLSLINWEMARGYPWAEEFDEYIKRQVFNKNHHNIINYENAGDSATLAFSTPEHFYPLLYVIGASDENDSISIFNDSCLMGSMSMTCYLFAP